jgi:hypothetical protein
VRWKQEGICSRPFLAIVYMAESQKQAEGGNTCLWSQLFRKVEGLKLEASLGKVSVRTYLKTKRTGEFIK